MLHKFNHRKQAKRLLVQMILSMGLLISFTVGTSYNWALRSAMAQQESNVATMPSASPIANTPNGIINGKIAFVSNRDNVERIYTINPDGSGLTQITYGPHQLQPAWSPQGTQIAFMDNLNGATALFLMNADGSNPKLLTSNVFHRVRIAWSPDGTKIAFCKVSRDPRSGSQFSLHVINADGTSEVRLATGSGAPAWSPDGKRIAFTRFRGIDVINADGTNRRQLGKLDSWFPKSLDWSPDGREIVIGSNRTSSDQNGNTIAPFTIEMISADQSEGNNTRLVGYGRNPSWSPDGSKILFERGGLGVPFTQIWVMDRDGKNKTQLTHVGTNWSPSWQALISHESN